MLGTELFARLRGDWRAGQAQEVRGVLAVPAQRVWVAEAGGEPIGFVAATLRQSGMLVAVIETGGDLGHTPARRIYEEAGYTALPAVRFFKACSGSRRRLAVAGLRF